jgi:hypothetical protein
MSLRTRRICVASMVTVSWRATASSNTVESSTRRCLPAMTPVSAITARTTLKIRSGSSLARSLLRHKVSTVGWNASSVNASPAAAFQAMSVCNARQASRSERPSKACSTITVATTSAGTDGRPRPDGNRSANISSGNNRWRCSARNACTDPSPSKWLHNPAASSSSRSGRDDPCTPAVYPTRPENASTAGLLSSLLERSVEEATVN